MMFQSAARQLPIERKWKTHIEIAPSCPRCSSSNTKFCYYNNYSLSQPRYFCRSCRRYWTKGGSLRNVPVGGGCRKSRRAKSSAGGLVSVNSGENSSGFSSVESGILQGSGSNNGNNNDGSEIDLAVVFAKFLNQESSFQPEIIRQGFPHEPGDQDFLSVSDSLSPPETESAVECKTLTNDYYNFQESNDLQQGFLVAENQVQKQQQQEIMMMESQEMNEFGLQTCLGNEIMQDSLWYEAETSLLNITWELPVDQVQHQEFDSFSGDDHQLNISTNLINDNIAWGSFDLSTGLEAFSRSKMHNLQEFHF